MTEFSRGLARGDSTVSESPDRVRLSLMIGRCPQTNGNTGHADPLKPGVATLTAELGKAGYYTAIVGKQPNYPPEEAFGSERNENETAATDAALAERVEFIKNRASEEFYDLRADPYCLDNRIADTAHASRMAEMKTMVEQRMKRTKDPLLAKFRGAGPIPPEWLTVQKRAQ